MELTLSPELEHRLELRLREGRWKTASEVLETALDLLDDMENFNFASREELNAKLEDSFAAAERGETISGKDLEAALGWGTTELQAAIDEGWEEAERGESMSGEEARILLAKMSEERRRARI